MSCGACLGRLIWASCQCLGSQHRSASLGWIFCGRDLDGQVFDVAARLLRRWSVGKAWQRCHSTSKHCWLNIEGDHRSRPCLNARSYLLSDLVEPDMLAMDLSEHGGWLSIMMPSPRMRCECAELTSVAGVVDPGHVYAVHVLHDVCCDSHERYSNTGYKISKRFESRAWRPLWSKPRRRASGMQVVTMVLQIKCCDRA